VCFLINHGADIHAGNNWPLRYASSINRLQVIQCLIDAGANVHAFNDAALYCASSSGHLKVVQCLLKAGANVHYALIVASVNGHVEVVQCLLDAGADIHLHNDYALGYYNVEDIIVSRILQNLRFCNMYDGLRSIVVLKL
jgi:ankyrin repeat protein